MLEVFVHDLRSGFVGNPITARAAEDEQTARDWYTGEALADMVTV